MSTEENGFEEGGPVALECNQVRIDLLDGHG